MSFPIYQGKLGYRDRDVVVALKNGTTDTPEAIYSDVGKLHVLPYLWNPNSLAFEVSTGGSTPGANVTVTNFPATQPVSGPLTDAQLRASAVPTTKVYRTTRFDDTGTYTYLGSALPGSAEGSSVWQIRRMTNATLTIVYADGDANFDNNWTNRASLSYS